MNKDNPLSVPEKIKIMAVVFSCRDGMMLREEFDGILTRIADGNPDEFLDKVAVQTALEARGLKVAMNIDGMPRKSDIFTWTIPIEP